MEECDYFVIGGGSGGVRSARVAAKLGAKVVLAESNKMGGTCVNVGCVPKKIFAYAAKFKKNFYLANQYGWDVKFNEFDWPAFIAKKNIEIARLNKVYTDNLLKLGVKVINAKAKFLEPNIILADGKKYKAKYVLIATGGKSVPLNVVGKELALNSDQIFYLTKLPKKMLIFGAGYIGTEFASIFNNFGVKVDIAYRSQVFLRGFDSEIVFNLKQSLIQKGVNFLPEHSIKKLEKIDNQIQVEFTTSAIDRYDIVLSAVGRSPNLESLNLENTAVTLNSKGFIVIDSNFETTQKSVFAIGDVSSKLFLTPIAIREGAFLANHLFGSTPKERLDYAKVATTVFCDPQLSTVGLTEEQANLQNIETKIYRSSFNPMFTSFAGDKTKFFIKLITEKTSQKILGLHILGDDSAEIMQGFASLLSMGATKQDLDKIVAIHPTSAEEIVTLN